MKKVTFLTCVLALCTSTMFAQTLEVTTADMDPVAAGGLVYVIDHAESGSVIEFNFDGEVLDYGEGTGIAIKGKKLTFNGINKKNGKRVTIKGLESLFTVGEASEISLNDLIIDGFKNIAIRLSGNSTLNANNCQFSNNYEPLSSKVNNGGVIYNPQIQISEKSQTKRPEIADSRKTKRPKIDKRTTPNKRHSNAIITL